MTFHEQVHRLLVTEAPAVPDYHKLEPFRRLLPGAGERDVTFQPRCGAVPGPLLAVQLLAQSGIRAIVNALLAHEFALRGIQGGLGFEDGIQRLQGGHAHHADFIQRTAKFAHLPVPEQRHPESYGGDHAKGKGEFCLKSHDGVNTPGDCLSACCGCLYGEGFPEASEASRSKPSQLRFARQRRIDSASSAWV